MFKYAQIKNGRVVGLQESQKEINHPNLILCDDSVQIGFVYDGEFKIYIQPLEEVKADKIAQIKIEASERIKALDWMHSRSDRHTALGEAQKKAKNEVYQLQQDIEEASDLAETEVNALTTVEAVQAFTW